MVIIMDEMFGEGLSEMERYGDEVLNASWLPQTALMFAAEAEDKFAHSSEHVQAATGEELDALLHRIYLTQE